jgi:cytidylate kinase
MGFHRRRNNVELIDVVTVDGPAGAGKSVVTRKLAARLGIEYLNTGAMYRAIALQTIRLGLDLEDVDALTRVARESVLESRRGRTFLNGEDVTDAVRAQEISQAVRYPANAPPVRAILVEQQRRIGLERPIATEGRDQGAVVFPDARCKFFLTASPEERARRRLGELRRRGDDTPFELVLEQIIDRDRSDMEREVGPLCEPEDAVRVDSDGKSIEEVVAEMERTARERLTFLQ